MLDITTELKTFPILVFTRCMTGTGPLGHWLMYMKDDFQNIAALPQLLQGVGNLLQRNNSPVAAGIKCGHVRVHSGIGIA